MKKYTSSKDVLDKGTEDIFDQNCIFCNPLKKSVLFDNNLAYAFQDKYPVTPLHCLVIPYRHIPNYFSLTTNELLACNDLLLYLYKTLKMKDHSIKGYNIGVNIGEESGQTIFHCHLHLIPRRKNDIENPQGGVRNIIPGKGIYKTL